MSQRIAVPANRRTAARRTIQRAVGARRHGPSARKDELRVAAMRELNVSKNVFDFAWIDPIETTGRHDWYEDGKAL
jgi:hypothetical protein